MQPGKQLRISGYWADEIAPWGDLAWETSWGTDGGGLHEVTWSMATTAKYRHRALRGGALVELMDGANRLGMATMRDPDVASGQFAADGLYLEAEHYLCLDGSGNGTSVPHTAIDQAIVRGCRIKRDVSFYSGNFTAGGTTEGANYLSTLLTAVSTETSGRWYVDADGYLTNKVDPTTPAWFLAPELTDLGVDQTGYASDLYGRRMPSGGGYETETAGDATARATFGRHEEAVDLTPLGVISEAKAVGILAGLLRDKARPAFSQQVEVTADQLLTAGGVRADLSMVRAGQMVRSTGLYDDSGALAGRTYLDWIIGRTNYSDGAETVTLSPLGLTPRDLKSVVTALWPRRQFTA